MNSVLYLSGRYLRHHSAKTALLVLALALVLYIPAVLWVLARQGEEHLRARSAGTPLLIGAKGSPLELVLNSLYFRSRMPAPMHQGEADRIAESDLALPIPLYIRFRCQGDPIVATSLDYFKFRNLEISAGRQLSRLGDCVVGAELARRRKLHPGDVLMSSPEQTFNVAGVFPLKMRVTGVLASANSPDDDAIFTDVKTAWLIEGIGHGHEASAKPLADPQQYTEVTDANIESFHFHGDPKTFLVTALLVVPTDDRAGTRLMGRYLGADQTCQAVEPDKIMNELLGTVVTVKKYALTALGLVAFIAIGLMILIEMLSIRLRQREIEALVQIGGSRLRIAALLAAEGCFCLLVGIILAASMTALSSLYGSTVVRNWIGS